MYCRCSNYVAVPQIYSHGVHCLSTVPFIPVTMAILGLVTTYMNLLSTWNALKSNFIRVMSNPTPPRTKKERQNLRGNTELLYMADATYIYARVHVYNVCAHNCLLICVVCTCIHAYSVNAMCEWCECVCVYVCSVMQCVY